MSVTLGIYNVILIFFFIVVPGYILRRFYYQSEFSKQLYSYTGQTPNLIYSFIVGLMFTIMYVFFINLYEANTIDIENILIKFDKNFISSETVVNSSEVINKRGLDNKFSNIYSKMYDAYLPYLFSIYLLAAFCGYMFFKIVVYFNLDAIMSLLRFKNSWHYLFTGRILKNFKFKNSIPKQLKVKYTYLDVLVCEQSEKPKLYSGLYVDYDLNTDNPIKLEKLYLLRPIRYVKNGKDTIKRKIPGKVFTIMGENILNINCTYIFEQLEEKKHKLFLRKRSVLAIGQILNVSAFVFTSIVLFLEINLFDSEFLTKSFEYSFLRKILLLIMFNVILGVLTPFNIDKKEEEIKFIGFTALLSKFIVFAILFLIIYHRWFLELLSDFF